MYRFHMYMLKFKTNKNLHKSLTQLKSGVFKNIYVNYCWNFLIVWEIENVIAYMLTDIINHWYYIYWVLQLFMLASKSASHFANTK